MTSVKPLLFVVAPSALVEVNMPPICMPPVFVTSTMPLLRPLPPTFTLLVPPDPLPPPTPTPPPLPLLLAFCDDELMPRKRHPDGSSDTVQDILYIVSKYEMKYKTEKRKEEEEGKVLRALRVLRV